MTIARNIAAALLFSLFLVAVPQSALAENISELHILPDGSLTSKAVVVTQKAGSNLFCRVAWGNTFIRLTVLIHPDTEVTRKFGGRATADDIREGDMLEVSGFLSDGTGNLVVKAKKVKDLMLTTEPKEIAGTVTGVAATLGTFNVAVKGLGNIKVAPSASAVIKKGLRTIAIGELVAGDKILIASGSYDYPTKTLSAGTVEVYQDKKVFAARTFEGVVSGISGTVLPATITFTSGGRSYTVYLTEASKITSKSKAVTQLSRVAVGDKVIVSGKISELNLSEIMATGLRDLAF